MSSAASHADAAADADPTDGRDETHTERLDRNWSEILQELRVLQTGTQILTGFLLAMAFQQRFLSLSQFELGVYLTLVSFSVLAAVLALVPVALHRALFHRHAKVFLVRAANWILRATLVVVGITLSGIILLIFDVVIGWPAGVIAGTVTGLVCVGAWLTLPTIARRRKMY